MKMIQFANHAFRGLDDSMRQLFSLLQSMGEHIEEIIDLMPGALAKPDAAAFESAKAIDKQINEAELAADKLVSQIIGKFNTTGEDLRFVIGSIKIAGILERSADRVKNCLKRLSRMEKPVPADVRGDLAKSIAAVRAMLPLTLKQVIDYKEETTKELLQHGAEVQEAYRKVLITLHTHMQAQAGDDTHILLVAKNLEQTADMAVEIMKISHFIHFQTKYEKTRA